MNKTYLEKTIDVIIPVYKGFNDTILCINSVVDSYTKNIASINLIVIDDFSPNSKLSKQLIHLANKYKFTLLKNEKNLGFVATVNRGMSQTSNDVILLNSDTEVAGNWLDKLAYFGSLKDTASVTPFSNNATICSFPETLQNNELPIGESLDSLNKIFFKENPKKSIEIPTAVGFCMYIPRKAIDLVGLFDVETFKKGYGEENDFSFRAKKLGLKNLLALDTFVKHTGGVSFAESQEELQITAGKYLLKKHPDYNTEIKKYISLDPAKKYRERVLTVIKNRSLLELDSYNVKNINFKKIDVLHITKVVDGGTISYLNLLSEGISTTSQAILFINFDYAILNYEGEFYPLKNYDIDKVSSVNNILDGFAVSKVHLHTLDNLSRFIISNIELDYIVTLHDSLFINNSSFNNLDGHNVKPNFDDISKIKPILKKAQNIISPSKYIKDIANKYYPNTNITLIPHGIKNSKLNENNDFTLNIAKSLIGDLEKSTNENDETIKIVVIGNIGPHKGDEYLIDLIKNSDGIQFIIIGVLSDWLESGIFLDDKLIIHGPYLEQELGELISIYNPKFAFFPPGVAESFSFTLSHCWNNNLSVLSPDYGAIGDRVKDTGFGITYPEHTSTNDLISIIKNNISDFTFSKISKKISENKNYLNDEWQNMVDNTNKLYLQNTSNLIDTSYVSKYAQNELFKECLSSFYTHKRFIKLSNDLFHEKRISTLKNIELNNIINELNNRLNNTINELNSKLKEQHSFINKEQRTIELLNNQIRYFNNPPIKHLIKLNLRMLKKYIELVFNKFKILLKLK